MKRLRSAFLARSPMCFCTYAASIFTVSPVRSGAEKEISSSTRSITVCNRRAPIFSTLELTATATSATASIESSENSNVTPSVASSATYCLISEASGSVRIRRRASRVRGFRSARMGKRPPSAPGAVARHVGADTAVAGADLVDLIEKDDTVLLHRPDGLLGELIGI